VRPWQKSTFSTEDSQVTGMQREVVYVKIPSVWVTVASVDTDFFV